MADYIHGHTEGVLKSHSWRTAANSAAYLLDDLRSGLDVLDVGCGPGTITVGLAQAVSPGRVVGIDTSQDVLRKAGEYASGRAVENVLFEVADVMALPFHDRSFDVVHAHQVLQHLPDPVAALREMHRVLRPGGTLAVRDADYGAMRWFPASDGLTRWQQLYTAVARTGNGEPDAGRYLPSWVRAAGFRDLTVTASTWCFAEEEARRWWGGTWAKRVRESRFGQLAVERGLAEQEELDHLAQAWLDWAEEENATFVVVHDEVLARR